MKPRNQTSALTCPPERQQKQKDESVRKRVSRRQFLNVLGAGAAFTSFFSPQTRGQESVRSQAKPRNIIFILSDDHRYDFFGFMDKPRFLKTPNFDRLALQGAHLENAFVVTSLCSPSRASILTGLYPHAHGVVDNDSPMLSHKIFFPTYVQQHGYKTAFVGKWHMGGHTDEPQPGFDRWVSFPGHGTYHDPVLNIDGTRKELKGYITDLLTDYAVDWVKEQRQKPFFLYLSHKAVHSEFEPAKRHLGKYDGEKVEHPASMADTEENYKDKPRWVREQRFSWHGVDFMYHGALDFDTLYKRYCETLLSLDDSIGRIIKALERQNLLKSTLILYAGDNGFSMGEHGLIDKRQMYEESIRIPLLAHCPELIRPKTKVKEFIQNVDFAPTILEAAGIPPSREMQGSSFLPLLKGEQKPWRKEVFYAYYWERPFPHTPTMFGIRTEQYKYVTYHGVWDIDELYDIAHDPHEMTNLINKKEHEELVKDFRKRVFDWLEQQDALSVPLKRSGLWQAAERKPHHEW